MAIIRTYVSFCVLISTLGVLSWVLIAFNITSADAWMVNIGNISSGFPDRGMFYQTAPYYLSLVQINEGGGTGGFTIFNIPFIFPRLAGISSESNYAALLIAPSIFFVSKVGYKRLNMRISFCILSLFVFLTLSVTAYLIFTTLVPIYSLKTKNKKIFFVWIFVLVFSAYHYSQTHSSLAEGTDLIRNKASVASSTINFLEGIYKTNNFLTPGFGSYFQGGFPGKPVPPESAGRQGCR